MATYLSEYFGEIDLAKPEEWYETEIQLNEQAVEILMTCLDSAPNLDEQILQRIDTYIDNFEANESNIRLVIHKDFAEEGETKDYIEDQIEAQEKEDIAGLIENANKKLSKGEKLLSVLTLLRVVFYPESEDIMFAVFDYTIDEELTDDLLVIKLYKDNHITIDIES